MAETFFEATNTLARDSVRLGMPWLLRTAALVLTFLAGPVGFLVHVVGRAFLRHAGGIDEEAKCSPP